MSEMQPGREPEVQPAEAAKGGPVAGGGGSSKFVKIASLGHENITREEFDSCCHFLG